MPLQTVPVAVLRDGATVFAAIVQVTVLGANRDVREVDVGVWYGVAAGSSLSVPSLLPVRTSIHPRSEHDSHRPTAQLQRSIEEEPAGFGSGGRWPINDAHRLGLQTVDACRHEVLEASSHDQPSR